MNNKNWNISRRAASQIRFVKWIVCCAFTAAALCAPVEAYAEEPRQEGHSVAAPLPISTAENISPLSIGVEQVPQFRKLLLPELYPLVRAGILQLDGVAKSRFDWGLSSGGTISDQERANLQKELQTRALSSTYELPGAYRQQRAPLFDGRDIQSNKINPSEVLWNGTAVLWNFPIQSAGYEIAWFKQGKIHAELRLEVARAYPAQLPGVTAGVQLMRERALVTYPEELAGLAFLTYRFLGADEDLIWGYSPAIRKARQIAGATHSDGILQSPLALADLSVWNGKHELVEPAMQLTQEALIPVTGLDLLPLQVSSQGCLAPQLFGTKPGTDLAQRWVGEGRSAWSIFHALTYAVPRKILRIELQSKDPFSEYGRQVLTIDEQLQIPVMKLVYDRSGQPWKLVLSSLGIGEAKNEPRRAIMYPLTIVHDYRKDETILLRQTSGLFCDRFSDVLPEINFDLRTFAGQELAQAPGLSEAKGASKENPQ